VNRRFRLTRSTEFMRVRRSGKSYAHPLVVLIVRQSEHPGVRIGVAASQAVGNAVSRNRAKRRLRACISEWLSVLPPHRDLVLLARRPLLEADFSQLCMAVRGLLERSGLVNKVDDRTLPLND